MSRSFRTRSKSPCHDAIWLQSASVEGEKKLLDYVANTACGVHCNTTRDNKVAAYNLKINVAPVFTFFETNLDQFCLEPQSDLHLYCPYCSIPKTKENLSLGIN
jgi:hypothetical protein